MSPRLRPQRIDRGGTSRVLHGLDWIASKSWVAAAIVIADLLWVAVSVWYEFPSRLETIFQTLVAAVTLAMVFVIQHTQARQQAVTQRKLDEILHALPEADNALVTLEDAPDHAIKRAAKKHRNVREEAIAPDEPVQ